MGRNDDAGDPIATLPDTFEALYPVLLLRKISDSAKAAIWSRYKGRWVRWTGRIVGFTRDGVALRMSPLTATFDLSLQIDVRARPHLVGYRVGQDVTFVGRLNSFDDVWRRMYLDQGDVVPVEARVIEVPAPVVRPAARRTR